MRADSRTVARALSGRGLRILLGGAVVAGMLSAVCWPSRLQLSARAADDPARVVAPLVAMGVRDGVATYLDSVSGRVITVPQKPTAAGTSGTPATGSTAQDGTSPAPGAGGAWDPRLTGRLDIPQYDPVTPASGPGYVQTILGGLCDGLPGAQVAVDPGTVKVDTAGRVFWVDANSTEHFRGLVYVRVLDIDGRVRTLGNIGGPVEGRFFRDDDLSATDARLAPDGQGGVYYSFRGTLNAGQNDPGTPQAEASDTPDGALIGHLGADGTPTFVAGSTGQSSSGAGGPVAQAGFAGIDDFTLAASSSMWVADGPLPTMNAGMDLRGGPSDNVDGGGAIVGSGPVDLRTLRYLNRSTADVTFFPGTPIATRVQTGTAGSVAGTAPAKQRQRPQPGHPVRADLADIAITGGLASDARGNLLVLESTPRSSSPGDVRILGINTGGSRALIAGTPVDPGYVAVVAGQNVGDKGDGGPASAAEFKAEDSNGWYHGDIAVAPDGGVLIADTGNNRVRRIAPDGTVSTVIGTGSATFDGDGRSGPETSVWNPMGVDVSPSGEIVVSDWENARIRVLTRGVVHTIAGTGQTAECGDGAGPVRHPAAQAGVHTPAGVSRNHAFTDGAGVESPRDTVEDGKGNVYVADPDTGVVRRIRPDGAVEIVAGHPRTDCAAAPPYVQGAPFGCPPAQSVDANGVPPAEATLESPAYLALDRYDNLYISDGSRLRYINFSTRQRVVHGVAVEPGTIRTLLTSQDDVLRQDIPLCPSLPGLPACSAGSTAFFYDVIGFGPLELDDRGTLYISDIKNARVLSMDWCGNVAVVAGGEANPTQGVGTLPQQNDGDGGPATAALVAPRGLAWDRARNLLLIGDVGSQRVRVVNLGTQVVSVFGRVLPPGFIDTYAGGAPCGTDSFGALFYCSYGDGGPARNGALFYPFGVAIAANGRVLISELLGRIRAVAGDGTLGTVAGIAPDVYGIFDSITASFLILVPSECGDGGLSNAACFGGPTGISVTRGGDLLVADFTAGRVRRITDIADAPLRSAQPPTRGVNWRFSPPLRLADPLGYKDLDPQVAFDSTGEAYVLSTLRDQHTSQYLIEGSNPVGCGLWRYRIAQGGGNRDGVDFLGSPDGAVSVPGGVFTPTLKGACSLAGAPQTAGIAGGLAPPAGIQDRLLYASGARGTALSYLTQTPGFTTGASRDGGTTFLSSPFGAAGASASMEDPWVVGRDQDESYVVWTDPTIAPCAAEQLAQPIVPGLPAVSCGFVDAGISVGGTEYAQTGIAYRVGQDPNDFGFSSAYDTVTSAPAANPPNLDVAVAVERCTPSCAAPDYAVDTALVVAHSGDDGRTWTTGQPFATLPCWRFSSVSGFTNRYPEYCDGWHGIPQLAEDAHGTLYVAWDDSQHVYLATSGDHGATWTRPRRVDSGVAVAAYPTLVVGDEGRVAVAFLGSGAGHDDTSLWGSWWVYMSQSLDARQDHADYTETLVSRYAVHHGPLCQNSLFCENALGGSNAGQEAGDYFSIGLDPKDGRVTAAYTEDRGIAGRYAGVEVTRQCDGPGLYAAKPAGLPCPADAGPPPAVATPVTTACSPQAADSSTGDAQWQGASRPSLDLTALGVQKVQSDLVVRMDVAAFSSLPPPPATGAMWTAFWRYGEFEYWAQAASPAAATGPPAGLRFQWGVVDHDGSLASVGTATGSVNGNSIVISVPAQHAGDPQPGTALTSLHARTDVLTGTTPDLAAVTPTSQSANVDTLSTDVGYDPGLACGPGGAASPSATPLPLSLPVAPMPVTVPALPSVPAEPSLPAVPGLPAGVPAATPPALPAAAAQLPPVPLPAVVATAVPSPLPGPAAPAPGSGPAARSTDPSWSWRLIHEAPSPQAARPLTAPPTAPQAAAIPMLPITGVVRSTGPPLPIPPSVPGLCTTTPEPPDQQSPPPPPQPPPPPPPAPAAVVPRALAAPPPPPPAPQPPAPISEAAPGTGNSAAATEAAPGPSSAQVTASQASGQPVVVAQHQERHQTALAAAAQQLEDADSLAMSSTRPPQGPDAALLETASGLLVTLAGALALRTRQARAEARRRRQRWR